MRLKLSSISVVVSGLIATATAQTGSHTHEFTPFPEATVTGVIERVVDAGSPARELCQACSDCSSTHVLLRLAAGHVDVHLAPAWFLERSGFVLIPGDVVSVTGTRIRIGDERGVAAREVRREGVIMKFRDEHGLPLWRRELTEA